PARSGADRRRGGGPRVVRRPDRSVPRPGTRRQPPVRAVVRLHRYVPRRLRAGGRRRRTTGPASDTGGSTGMSGDGRGGDRRRKLLEGAMTCLTEQGIAKTSARTIAAAAGVNQALVFYHFGSVDELLVAAGRHGAEQHLARFRHRFATVRT